MATATYDLIASQTLASAASSITFSSIAASWTDLRLVLTASATSATTAYSYVNGDNSGGHYSSTNIYGDGTNSGSQKTTNTNGINLTINSIPTGKWATFTIDYLSYAGSTYKTYLTTESNDQNGTGYTSRWVALWRNTAAITSVTLYVDTTFATGTTASLYGIKAA